jgi:hypothetical protein
MYSASRSIRAVALLIVCNLSGAVAFPQGVKFIHDAVDPLPFAKLPVGMAACASAPRNALASAASAPCDTTPVSVPSVNPCPAAKPGQWGCEAPRDLAPKDLAAMGKPGKKIMRARDRVLEILQTENACSEWFRQTDASAAAGRRPEGERPTRLGRPARARAPMIPKSSGGRTRKAGAGRRACPY